MVATVPGQVINKQIKKLEEASKLVYVSRPSIENINSAQAKLREVIKELPNIVNWLETFKK